MVARKVRVAMGFKKSPSPSPQKNQPPTPSTATSATNSSSHKSSFSRYFPRTSAQVQPKPLDVTELLRLVDSLRESESILKIELLEYKLLKESIAIVPVLENEIEERESEIEMRKKRIEDVEAENERLKNELHELKLRMEEEKRENERKIKALKNEIAELKKTASFTGSTMESEEHSCASQRFVEVSMRSSIFKNFKKTTSDNGTGNLKREVVAETEHHSRCNSEELTDSTGSVLNVAVRSRAPRVPKPPPRPSSSSPFSVSSGSSEETENVITQPPNNLAAAPPPPPPPPKPVSMTAPPPPPPKGGRTITAKVRRVPEVVEFYHSLTRRDSQSRRNLTSGSGATEVQVMSNANARDMIGEIENRSSHLLAIKTDVETHRDFIRHLIKELEGAAFTNIEDVVPFVKWLDDELSYLVDERAVLKHFDWPEQKADALREAAFAYCDMKKLEYEALSLCDDPRQSCGTALKKMQAFLEKLEHGVYSISRMRESATKRYRVFRIPVDWMLDNGYASQIKLVSVKLAMKYMKRVSAELETVVSEPEEEELILQGVRFAYRVHQFAGGFDVETMRAFQELRDKARSCHVQQQ
ncbi:hypothetical protein Lal_00016159 [Lupinus albus]|uniref:Uncharacterized protein n=1 Tax=Lupinus albus TaxID=3870 RepID=A0A6A4QGP7_LUPAL|nr:hypothetical protein Lalb_Chr05g0218761 [Lupinus albus]KAF1873040.1 hypothetical protein Lal_00016159 [Lupinus albus]